jgi:monoterpene epsilon-lactone hydrolase
MGREISTAENLLVSAFAIPEEDRENQRQLFERNAALLGRFGDDRRGAYSAMCALTPIAKGVAFSAVETDVKGWWITPSAAASTRVVLFIHGGGYHLGDAASYRGFASQIALKTGCPVFAVDYPLAPEHRFPFAYDAILRAADWLTAGHTQAYAVMGDSAGGGLALALAKGAPSGRNPRSVVVFSPWTDLALTGSSFNDPATTDPVFKPDMLAGLAQSYLNGADPRDWRASPLYGIPSEPPPMLIQAGTHELLLDDATRYAKAVASKGGEVFLELYEGLHHVFQRDTGTLTIADQALNRAAEFVSRHWET